MWEKIIFHLKLLYRKKSPYPKPMIRLTKNFSELMVIEEYKSNNKLQKYIDYNKLIKFINSPKDYGKTMVWPANGWSTNACICATNQLYVT